ncbi:uncharacterized protein LOC112053894 [Bicyclus anynana]|uniref:Uncharacterized protein LOC112053894 n=1 Tax=Bicyclus anynana TaxID=110368 RepID=A0A6J1NR17_BICAN|nr:uncharacterized protein LOC112053894 [Bicyclus anynana]
MFEDFPNAEFAGSRPWGVKALIHNHNMLVLPDLSVEGYTMCDAKQYLDLDHVKVALKSLARFHAAFAKHQTRVTAASDNYKLPENYTCFLKDQFCECPWLRATIKLTTNFLKEFATDIKHYPSDLDDCLRKWCIDACNSLREYENTLNVIIHKDLWANNIMFKYSADQPVNAVLVDFQCARYGPPAIDVMVFLYYTTSRKFREYYEKEVLNYYYSIFLEAIDESTERRLAMLNYDRQMFINLCDKLRPAGMIVPLAISPFILMSPQAAQESFDNPETFHEHFMVDRCGPVIAYARDNEYYKTRVLEIFEEFVERHLTVK